MENLLKYLLSMAKDLRGHAVLRFNAVVLFHQTNNYYLTEDFLGLLLLLLCIIDERDAGK